MGPGKLVVLPIVEDNPLWRVPSTVSVKRMLSSTLGFLDLVSSNGPSKKVPGASFDVLAETVKKTAFKITRVGQLVGQMASERLGVEFGIVDLFSRQHQLLGIRLPVSWSHGAWSSRNPWNYSSLALLNDQVKKGGIMA